MRNYEFEKYGGPIEAHVIISKIGLLDSFALTFGTMIGASSRVVMEVKPQLVVPTPSIQ
jgi:hypothetical protein